MGIGSVIGGVVGGAGGSLIGGLFGGKGNPLAPHQTTQDQVPLETPEQKAARQMLLKLAQSGAFGDFKVGQNLNLGLGDFGMTGTENQGMSSLQNLLSSGIPDQFKLGDQALQDILATSPQQIESQFSPYKAQVERQITDSNNALKRGSAFAGNLYSTNTVQRLGDIQARGNETLASQLANLTNEAMNRRLQAVPLAYQSGQAQEGINQNRIASAFQYGQLPRTLNDAAIKARDAEVLRRRSELAMPIQAAQTVSGQNANFGVPSVTTSQPSELMQLLQIFAPVAGQLFGRKGA